MNDKDTSISLSQSGIECFIRNHLGVDDLSIHVFDELDSTNRWLLDFAKHNAISDVLCIADRQSAGRGRSGRVWVSPAGSNIYMSFSRMLNVEINRLPAVSLVVGLGLVRVLRRAGVDAMIKWPNDVLVAGQKIAGVLIETCMVEGRRVLVIGLGVNVCMSEKITNEYGISSTDMRENGALPEWLDRNRMIAEVYNEASLCLDAFEQSGFSGFQQEWNECDAYYRKRVCIKDRNQVIAEGVESGVNDQAMLMLDTDGQIKYISSGDLSLRVSN